MSSPFPSENPTFGPLHVGNVTDDDGQVIDSFLVETDAPPTPDEMMAAGIQGLKEPLHEPEPATRLITATWTLQPSWSPFKILVADPGRVQLRLRAMSLATTPAVATDFVVIGFDQAFTQANSGFRLWNSVPIDLDDHTGDLFLGCNPNAQVNASGDAFVVTMLAVTKGNR